MTNDGSATYRARPTPDRAVISGPDIVTFTVRYVARSELDTARKARESGSISEPRGGSANWQRGCLEERANTDDRHDSMSKGLG